MISGWKQFLFNIKTAVANSSSCFMFNVPIIPSLVQTIVMIEDWVLNLKLSRIPLGVCEQKAHIMGIF